MKLLLMRFNPEAEYFGDEVAYFTLYRLGNLSGAMSPQVHVRNAHHAIYSTLSLGALT
jgi:hypothetical protein